MVPAVDDSQWLIVELLGASVVMILTGEMAKTVCTKLSTDR